MILEVPPTGNVATDTANLQAALDALSLPRSGAQAWEWGTLRLSGTYYVNATLKSGDATRKAARIEGGNAAILWRGDKTDQPVLAIGTHDDLASGGLAFGCLVRDLLVVPNKLARGIRIQRQGYRSLLENVHVYDARQVAVDLIDCWGSSARDVQIKNARGIGLRTVAFNRGTMHGLRVSARAEDFPPTDDITVLRHNGQPVQTPERNRAAIVGLPSHVSQLLMESLTTFTDLPLIYTGTGSCITGAHFEGNACRDAYIVCEGGWDVASGRGFTVEHFSVAGPQKSRAFIELRGRTFDVHVADGQFLNALRDTIIYAVDGAHYGPTVERVGSYGNWIDPDHEITAVAGAQLLRPRSEMKREQAPPPPA